MSNDSINDVGFKMDVINDELKVGFNDDDESSISSVSDNSMKFRIRMFKTLLSSSTTGSEVESVHPIPCEISFQHTAMSVPNYSLLSSVACMVKRTSEHRTSDETSLNFDDHIIHRSNAFDNDSNHSEDDKEEECCVDENLIGFDVAHCKTQFLPSHLNVSVIESDSSCIYWKEIPLAPKHCTNKMATAKHGWLNRFRRSH